MLIHDKFYCEGDYNYLKFRKITKGLSKRQCVEFALFYAKDVFHLVEERGKENAKLCIDLVEKWLKDEKSVTSEELKQASNVSWADADAEAEADADAAYAVSYAAYAAYAVYDVVSYAAWAAVCATRVNAKSNKFNEYLVIANSYLTKTNTNCPNYEIEGKNPISDRRT